VSQLKWMNNLKTYHWDYQAKLIFVHAGIDLNEFPNDGAETHLWTRTERFFNSDDWPEILPIGTKVVHGHTPTAMHTPEITTGYKRINVDTGACYGGKLTAAVLAPGENPRFLSI